VTVVTDLDILAVVAFERVDGPAVIASLSLGIPVKTVRTIKSEMTETTDALTALGVETTGEGDHPLPLENGVPCAVITTTVSKCHKTTCSNCKESGHISVNCPLPKRRNVHFSQSEF